MGLCMCMRPLWKLPFAFEDLDQVKGMIIELGLSVWAGGGRHFLSFENRKC